MSVPGSAVPAFRPPPAPVPIGPRQRPRTFWTAILVAVALLAGGIVVATLGYAKTSGPDGAVRGYFAALIRGDAPAALAFGGVPRDVPHTLLTDDVLAEQQRIAPIDNVVVDDVKRAGGRASLRVRYTLAFPSKPQQITATVRLHTNDGDWRLDNAAVETQLLVGQADQRASILGAGIPDGTAAVFPGAVPVRYDSEFLQLDPSQSSVSFDAGASTQIFAQVSPVGKRAAALSASAALRACLVARAESRCPLPGARSVPGSLRGSLIGDVQDELSVDVTADSVGSLDITGKIRINGSYRTLSFTNQIRTKTGVFTLPIHARAYGLDALTIVWEKP